MVMLQQNNKLTLFSRLFQMHHPIQMKPADSENRNGEYKKHFFSHPDPLSGFGPKRCG